MKVIEAIETAGWAWDALDGKQGQDIALLDVRGISSLTDYVLLCTGNSAPHLKALRNEVLQALKSAGVQCYRGSGSPESGWLTLDYLDVIIHVLSRESRKYYAIEDLWDQAPRIARRSIVLPPDLRG